jgi:hypothetical protein
VWRQGCWDLLRTRGTTITAAYAALEAVLGAEDAAEAAMRAPWLLRTSAHTLRHGLPALERLLGPDTARALAMRNLELMRYAGLTSQSRSVPGCSVR